MVYTTINRHNVKQFSHSQQLTFWTEQVRELPAEHRNHRWIEMRRTQLKTLIKMTEAAEEKKVALQTGKFEYNGLGK